ncbi:MULTISPECIES: hypothetical protein [unclassified Variovorax]|uniref:hypothetical protein n=1 Tax=unclassified Variovorax TaxID=663243 RepID=UPI00022A6860|nr:MULTISPECIES: hypothetical protein [unclassified Variovorax]AEO20124.1 hypothetical protein VASRS_49 [Variovorax sp. SRS16]VTU42666.1 hypothetical protein SRS16P1_00327 [Variovorax sp. SRS16]VTU42696.1 hypothetical protein E5P1_00325 [Variovorax sp. PBL-E5]VTU43851.1 hypothetical protein H6P1_00603 [Variovorax sp. PBL-H6]
MICPQCEAENTFAAARCTDCGKPFGPSRDNRDEPASRASEVAPASNVTRPSSSASPAEVLGQPQNLDWLVRYALWGMPVTYIGLVAASAFGLKPPMLVFKVLLGGGALWPLRALLKKEPSNERALVARKFGRIQMAVMLAAELTMIPFMFVLPAQSWLLVGGIFLLVAFGVHLVVGVIGTRRLRGFAQLGG